MELPYALADYQNEIIEGGRDLAQDAVRFARSIEGADVAALQKRIPHDEPDLAYEFALTVKGADVEALQKIVLEEGTPDTIRMFARDVAGADIESLEDAVIDVNDPKEIMLFAAMVPAADIRKLQQAFIDALEPGYAAGFASIPGADRDALQEFVLKHGEAYDAYDFARYVPDSDADRLLDAVLAEVGEGARIAIEFAKHVPDADLDKISKFVREHGDESDRELFAQVLASERPQRLSASTRSR